MLGVHITQVPFTQVNEYLLVKRSRQWVQSPLSITPVLLLLEQQQICYSFTRWADLWIRQMLWFKSIGASGLLFLLWLWLFQTTEASVHDYNVEKFVSKGNAFVVHGGSEGIYSSVPNLTESPSYSSNTDSFIR